MLGNKQELIQLQWLRLSEIGELECCSRTHRYTHMQQHTQDGGLGFVLKLLAVCLVLHRLHLLLIACDW